MSRAAPPTLFLALMVACGVQLAAQQDSAVVAGRVHEAASGRPISGATINVGSRSALKTDSAGRFQAGWVAPGTYRIRARLAGFDPADTTITVAPGDSLTIQLTLRRQSVTLLPVVVAGETPRERTAFEGTPSLRATTLTADAMRSTPVALEMDVLRAVQLLPGVAARNDYNAGLYVEGGEADQTLVLLDGIPILNPFHLGGIFGTFIDGAVERVDLRAGGFAARYGGRMSSMLDVASYAERKPGIHGSMNVSLLSSNATLGSSFGDGNGSWNVAARRTYLDLLGKLIDRLIPYHFSDIQAHTAYAFPTGTRLSFTGYYGSDVLSGSVGAIQDSTMPGSGMIDMRWGNRAAGMTIAQIIGAGTWRGDSTILEQRASLSRYRAYFDMGDGSFSFPNLANIQRLNGLVTRYGNTHTIRMGYEYDRYRVKYRVGVPQLNSIELQGDQQLSVLSLFAEDAWRLGSRVILNPGMRYEQVPGANWRGWSPRLAVKLFVSPNLAITLAGGRYTQWLQQAAEESAPLPLLDYWVASDAHTPVATAHHYVTSIEQWFGASRFIKLESFYKPYRNLNSPNAAADPAEPGSTFVRETGIAYGASLFARQLDIGRWSGWISYTYSVARRQRGDTIYAPLHDQRHMADLVVSTRRGPYVLGTRFGFSTGTPYTDITGEVQYRIFNPLTGTWEYGNQLPVYGPRNARRYPAYHRLDFTVSRTYQWHDRRITPSLAILNAYNRHNVFTYLTQFDKSPPVREKVSQFPLLPSIGIKVEF